MSNIRVEPFLKWAGGKRWLVNNQRGIFRSTNGRHIEPFLGSAAVFFALRPKKAILADLNPRLIETYKCIRDDYLSFENHFHWFAKNHSKDFYYEVRQKTYKSISKRAAHFLYLNRVCFNGIYRENLKGVFNVPLGSKTSALLDTDDFSKVSNLLQSAEILASDFESVIDMAHEGDFLYVDPPYTTKHNMNGFVKYNQKIFSWDDQKRLALAVKRANQRGVMIIVSNADHEEVRNLYVDTFTLRSVSRANVIASKSKYRGTITELIVSNTDSIGSSNSH